MICRAIPFEGKEPYIFVSYCHADKEILYPLFEQMAMDGYRIWYDDGNNAGDDWTTNIEARLEESMVCLAFISGNSSLSHNCKSEIVYALKCGKKIVPVLIETTDLPRGLRMQLSHLHYLKCADFPHNRALLNKIWEVDECKACKAPADSILLKPRMDTERQKRAVSGAEKSEGGILSGLSAVQVVHGKTPAGSASKPEEAQENKLPEEQHEVYLPVVEASEKKAVPETTSPPNPDKRPESVISGEGKLTQPEVREMKQDCPPDKSEESACSWDDVKTILVNADEIDELDKTVRVSEWNMALLLYPAGKKAYILSKPQTKLGRSPLMCDFSIEGNKSVSKYHADIIQYNEKCFLCDVGSSNGTFLNGKRLEVGEKAQLDPPAVFQLYNETLVFISGEPANSLILQGSVSFLINEKRSAVRIVDTDTIPLNRNNHWKDGTLSDPKVHRSAHAMLARKADGIYLVDTAPEKGNGTFLNDVRLKHGASCILTSGDRIRLGDTTLEFISITF